MTEETQPQVETHTIPGDTPTHRLHLMQMKINDVAQFVEKLRARRAILAERVVTAKKNSNIARALTVDKQFAKIVKKIDKQLAGIEADLEDAADELNKARALFFEQSGGEVIIPKEPTDGA
jgi:predicted site-specific integrase-resolvase